MRDKTSTREGQIAPAVAALNYYKAGVQGGRPDYVPSRIYLPVRVMGDGPFRSTFAEAGEHECSSNSWGALSVRATNGKMLGIKPSECEPVAWRENAVEASSDVKGPKSSDVTSVSAEGEKSFGEKE